ncbi:MAG: zinc ribbon domain-containing protein [Candidatus Paceibacterota bacterium]|jgi:putative FmdB family regulatory protein
MPTYEYFCPKCDNEIEIEHSIKESVTPICDKCKTEMKRNISGGTGFVLKDFGWPGKDIKEKRDKGLHSLEMEKRQKDNHDPIKRQ